MTIPERAIICGIALIDWLVFIFVVAAIKNQHKSHPIAPLCRRWWMRRHGNWTLDRLDRVCAPAIPTVRQVADQLANNPRFLRDMGLDPGVGAIKKKEAMDYFDRVWEHTQRVERQILGGGSEITPPQPAENSCEPWKYEGAPFPPSRISFYPKPPWKEGAKVEWGEIETPAFGGGEGNGIDDLKRLVESAVGWCEHCPLQGSCIVCGSYHGPEVKE